MEELMEGQAEGLSDDQKIAIAKWFLVNSPPGEIQYVSKGVRGVLMDDNLFNKAAKEAFLQFNKEHMICLELSDKSGQVLVTHYAEVDENSYIDPRTAQVAIVDHVKQVCTKVRPAENEELPSVFVEDYRAAIDTELLKYVEEAFPKGECGVYATQGKDAEKEGDAFEITAVISSSKFRPQNFCNGSWRSVWKMQMNDGIHEVQLKGQIQILAHYFEEGNVQLDTKFECKDSLTMQNPTDLAVILVDAIRQHESDYLACLEESYGKLSDNTFKELRRKLPVTRTLFPWHNARQLSLSRDITREMNIGK